MDWILLVDLACNLKMHDTGAMLNESLRGRVCMMVPAIQQFTMASKQTKLTVLGQRSRPCLTSGSQSQDFNSQDPGLGKSKTGQTSVTEHPSGKAKEGHHSEHELGCEFDYHAVRTSTRIRCCVLLDPSDKNCTGVVYCSNQKTPV